jgi:glycosyltransferase involved in cell wall biosynthesis
VKDVVAANLAGDIFMFPSYCENQGIAILEAAACEKPLIVRDLPVYERWLKEGENCLKAKDNAEFEEYVRSLLEDDITRLKLAKAAKKMSEEHDLKVVGKKLITTYEKAMEK